MLQLVNQVADLVTFWGHSNKSDGFRKKNLNTGFDITDLMGKIPFLQKKNLIFRNILSLNIIIMMKYQMKRIWVLPLRL